MYDRLEIFQIAAGLAKHSSARQSVIAQNVANADTPGFRAQDLKPFAELYHAAPDAGALRATRPGHEMSGGNPAQPQSLIDRPGPSEPNGNTVSLETEMVHSVEVKRGHDLALSVYQTSLGIIRTSLGRGR